MSNARSATSAALGTRCRSRNPGNRRARTERRTVDMHIEFGDRLAGRQFGPCSYGPARWNAPLVVAPKPPPAGSASRLRYIRVNITRRSMRRHNPARRSARTRPAQPGQKHAQDASAIYPVQHPSRTVARTTTAWIPHGTVKCGHFAVLTRRRCAGCSGPGSARSALASSSDSCRRMNSPAPINAAAPMRNKHTATGPVRRNSVLPKA